ncbi:WD40 repeat domain-containing protein [Chloropicon primus]|nr:WD40 repeat domain-containing protein [Chloropicon primus]
MTAEGRRHVEERRTRTRALFPRGGKGNEEHGKVGLEHLKRAREEKEGGERNEGSVRAKAKWREEYEYAASVAEARRDGGGGSDPASASASASASVEAAAAGPSSSSGSRPGEKGKGKKASGLALALPPASKPDGGAREAGAASTSLSTFSAPSASTHEYSASVIRRQASKWPKPVWHAPWKLYRVVSGHMGWVRSVAFDPSNSWFVTGSADRTIKVWDLASGRLKLTLTGHIEQVTGLAVSPRHPYMFSCGLDKQIKCWDLEYNKVIRHYHGHLSGIYALQLHPTLDLLFTGGRDCTCRVWDMRTKAQVHVLTGHDNTVCSILSQGTDPQVITGSHDSQIKLWDLVAAKPMTTLTHHKKSVRCLGMHPKEYSFCSASSDRIKKFALPSGKFMHNTIQQQRSIVNTIACNDDGVMVTGADNGNVWLWDWQSGNRFQEIETQVQPGSLDSENGIFASSFDVTGTRLLTCEADKTIKFYKEDLEATPETHPVRFKPPKDMKRF